MLTSTKRVDRLYVQLHLQNTYIRLAQLEGNNYAVRLVISLHKQALRTVFWLFITSQAGAMNHVQAVHITSRAGTMHRVQAVHITSQTGTMHRV